MPDCNIQILIFILLVILSFFIIKSCKNIDNFEGDLNALTKDPVTTITNLFNKIIFKVENFRVGYRHGYGHGGGILVPMNQGKQTNEGMLKIKKNESIFMKVLKTLCYIILIFIAIIILIIYVASV